MKVETEINGHKIGAGQPPFIIAEISGNHNGDIERAKELIKIAMDAGADAVKLQTYHAESLTIDSSREEFILKSGTWAGKNLFKLYQEAHTPWEWFPELFDYARALGITIFSSPFDEDAVELLEELKTPAYKIASNEVTDYQLLEKVVSTGKPLIISTGTSSKKDISDTLEFISNLGGQKPIVLHCISAYPASAQNSNLNTIHDIHDSFGVITGLSDHTLGTTTALAAIATGASVIEKHITLARDDGGPDSSFSLEPDELKILCNESKVVWQSLGNVVYSDTNKLISNGIFTRQYWSIQDIKKGDELTNENIKSIRAPANAAGISTKYYKDIFGKEANTDIPKHSPITADSVRGFK